MNVQPGLRATGPQGVLLLCGPAKCGWWGTCQIRVQELESENLVSVSASFGGCGTVARGLQCVCIIDGGLSWPFLRAAFLKCCFPWFKSLGFFHSRWMNFHHLLPASSLRHLSHLKEPSLLCFFTAVVFSISLAWSHGDFGISVVNPLLSVGFWQQMF